MTHVPSELPTPDGFKGSHVAVTSGLGVSETLFACVNWTKVGVAVLNPHSAVFSPDAAMALSSETTEEYRRTLVVGGAGIEPATPAL